MAQGQDNNQHQNGEPVNRGILIVVIGEE